MKRLVDANGLYDVLGECIMEFMLLKPQPYGTGALRSKENFWKVPVFKRALTFVFLMRYILGYKSQRMWNKFQIKDYKFNSRCFKRWCDKEDEIFEKCSKYAGLPETVGSHSRRTRVPRVDSFSSESPMKRRYVVNDESTSDDE